MPWGFANTTSEILAKEGREVLLRGPCHTAIMSDVAMTIECDDARVVAIRRADSGEICVQWRGDELPMRAAVERTHDSAGFADDPAYII